MRETYKTCKETLNNGKAKWDAKKSRFNCTNRQCPNLAYENKEGKLTPYCGTQGIISIRQDSNFYKELFARKGTYVERQEEL